MTLAMPTLAEDAPVVATVRRQPMATLRAASGPAPPVPAGIDAESRSWLRRLRAEDPEREEALGELREILLRAARFEIARRRARMPQLRGGDHEDIAQQSANDALVAVLAKLGDFRGDSRFTTWAYKFALYEAAVKIRRRAWQGREVPLVDPEGWDVMPGDGAPARAAEQRELLDAVREAIAGQLTAHQRDVLLAVTVHDVPIDVMAERLDTTRGALYKTIHDARRKLRAALAAQGFDGAG